MLKNITGFLLIATISLFTLYCSPKGSGMQSGIKTFNTGKASDYDLQQTLPRYLRKYQFQIKQAYSSDNYSNIESEWKTRYPKEDEVEKGVREGRIKLIFRIRKTSDRLNYVQMDVKNQIKLEGSGNWLDSPMTKAVEQDIKDLLNDLKREFAEGRLRR